MAGYSGGALENALGGWLNLRAGIGGRFRGLENARRAVE